MGQSAGFLGLLIFFSISGYLVTASWMRDPNLFRFLSRRFLRIWPALALCLTVAIVAVSMFVIPASSQAEILPKLLRNYAFSYWDSNFFPTNPVPHLNGSLWSIQAEVVCCVAVALVGLLARQYLRAALIGIAIVATILVLSNNWPAPSFGLPWYFSSINMINLPALFLAGSLLAVAPVLHSRKGAIALIVIALAAATAGKAAIAWVIAGPLLVIGVGLASWPVFRSAARFGDLSYGIFLWAWPVQQIGVKFFGTQVPLPALLGVTLLVVVPIAFFSWHLLEKHCLNLKPNTPLQGH